MFCPKCGKELADAAAFCTGCGTRMGEASAPAATPAAAPALDFSAKIKEVLGSGLFLAIAILSTLNALMYAGANIISLLSAIAMWVIYGAAKSANHTCRTGLKFSSGIIRAKFIINWICISVLAVVLVILLIFVPMVKDVIEEAEEEFSRDLEEIFAEMPSDFDVEEELDELLDEIYSDKDTVKQLEALEDELNVDLDQKSVEKMLDKFGYSSIEKGIDWMSDNRDGVLTKLLDMVTTTLIIVYAVMIVALILINILVIGRLKKFARSAWQSVEANDKNIINLKLLRSALVTAGILSLGAPFAAAACFVGVALVAKLRRELA